MARFFIFVFIASTSLAFASDHPLYHIGKRDYVYHVTPTTSLSDFKDPNKDTILIFSAEWSTNAVKFWPYVYTLQRMQSRYFNFVVVDMDKGWGIHEQFQREGKFKVTDVPYTVILGPGSTSGEFDIIHQGPSGPVLNEYIIPQIENRDPNFMHEFIPAVQANWDNIFLPTLQLFLLAEENAKKAGKNAIEARKIARAAVLEQL